MNELTLNVKQNPGVIELNFDEIEKALDAKLAEYKGAVFTEESKSIAKSVLLHTGRRGHRDRLHFRLWSYEKSS